MAMRFTSSWVLALMCSIWWHGAAQSQQLFVSDAVDIGAGADGTVWVIAGNPAPGNVINNNVTTGRVGLSRRGKDGTWTLVGEMPHSGGTGGAERIAVDPSGNAWIVTSAQQIFRFDGSQYKQATTPTLKAARDIGISASGKTIWATSNDPQAGGYTIYKSTDTGVSWTKMSGTGTDIAVDNQGNAWLVNDRRGLFRFDGATSNWMPINLPNNAGAYDVGVGGNNIVWVVSNAPVPGSHDFKIYHSGDSGKSWKELGGGLRVAVGPDGSAWIIDSAGKVSNTPVSNFVFQPPIVIGDTGVSIPVAPIEVPMDPCKFPGAYQSANGWMQGPTQGTLRADQPCAYDGPPIVVRAKP